MRKIIIAGSAFFYKEALELKKELEKKDYYVIDYPKKINDNIKSEYKKTYESFYDNLNKKIYKTNKIIQVNKNGNNIIC